MFTKKSLAVMASAAVMALTLGACGSGFDDKGDSGSETDELTILIGSSGDAETDAVKSAVEAWSKTSGVKAKVSVASDLQQQVAQGFAGGNPPDLFYLSNDTIATYAANGSLNSYLDSLSNKDDFYPSIVESMSYDGKPYAAPKDFSTLALIINEEKWEAAGLTDADIPTSWEQLKEVSTKLTTADAPGLTMSAEFARVGVFFGQNGGWLVDDAGKATVNSAENIEALSYVKELQASGAMKFAADVGAGWGGEAFGKGLAAMVIEGNWITGALTNDHPDLKYKVVELPAGKAGKSTMQFNGGWGLAEDSNSKENAKKLVEYLTQPEQQLTFSKEFGVMPSVKSAAEDWKTANPERVAFIEGADYAKSIPNVPGIAEVISDLNQHIEALSVEDPKTILDSVQTNLEAIIK